MIQVNSKKIQRDMIDKIISENSSVYVADRRYLHRNPELSFKEFNTSAYVKSRLDEMGVPYTSGLIGTDVTATVTGEKKSSHNPKCLLIRADMDALPLDEKNDVPYKSKKSGVMHACGHDGHTAILLGVCDMLNRIKSEFCGCVKLVFQPGEETDGGAKPLIDKGILEHPTVDACIALHMDPDIECGKIRIKKGSLYASPDDFKITVVGKGGHGAERENCIDPIEISAKIINSIINIPRDELSDREKAVVTVGTVNAGNASNVIPEEARMTGTARSLTMDVRNCLKKRIGEISRDICKSYGAQCEYDFIELFPPLVNDESLSDELLSSAKLSIGDENCITGGDVTMAGEDFSYFANEKPSVLFKLGCRNEERDITASLHNPMFDIDENSLSVGVKVFSGFVLDYLS